MITNEEIETLINFLNRVDLKGAEAYAFVTVVSKLSRLNQEIPSIPQDPPTE